MVQNLTKAIQYFGVGYVLAVGFSALLFPIPNGLRSLIIFTFVQLLFTELHFLYLKKTHCAIAATLSEVLRLGVLWAVLSLLLDVALFVLLVPGVVTGAINLAFFNSQPGWYWMQFPGMVFTGLIGRFTYVKVTRIYEEALRKEEVLTS